MSISSQFAQVFFRVKQSKKLTPVFHIEVLRRGFVRVQSAFVGCWQVLRWVHIETRLGISTVWIAELFVYLLKPNQIYWLPHFNFILSLADQNTFQLHLGWNPCFHLSPFSIWLYYCTPYRLVVLSYNNIKFWLASSLSSYALILSFSTFLISHLLPALCI